MELSLIIFDYMEPRVTYGNIVITNVNFVLKFISEIESEKGMILWPTVTECMIQNYFNKNLNTCICIL